MPSRSSAPGSPGEYAGTAEKAANLLRLHTDPELLIVVNVWDVISATVVAGVR
jgi:2-methylisocitrate lyase-like PEP mutase family enzyme